MYPRCLSVLLCAALSLTAGCSEDKNPPRIIAISPLPGAINAPQQGTYDAGGNLTNPMIKVQFNEELRETSVPPDAITLERNGQPVPGTFGFTPTLSTLFFEPEPDQLPLLFLRQYDIRLSAGIADRDGNATTPDSRFSFLATDGRTIETGPEWSFWIADGTFKEPALIENENAGDATEPQVAFGPEGHGQIIWVQTSGGRKNILARPAIGLSLGSLRQVEDDADDVDDGDVDVGDATSPQVAVDEDGNSMAVWVQFDGTINRIYANRYSTAGSTSNPPVFSWSKTPVALSNIGSDASAPQIAIGSDGNAVAVWAQSDGRVYASRYTGAWSAAETIDANTGTPADPQIVIDSNNTAIAVWAQNNRIYENRQVSGVWGAAATIDDGSGTATAAPQIAADSNGSALAVWSQSNGTYTSIWANRFTGNAWGTPVAIENRSGNANTPQIAINASGDAVAIWSQSSASAPARFRIRTSRFTPGGGWAMDADPIDNLSSDIYIDEVTKEGVSTAPQVAIDGDGNALAIWKLSAQIDSESRSFVAVNRYRGPSAHEDIRGWSNAALLDGTVAFTGETNSPQIAITPEFTAITVWSKHDGDEDDGLFHVLGSMFN